MTMSHHFFLLLFFFNDTATTEIYTLSLHDALPICHFSEPMDFVPEVYTLPQRKHFIMSTMMQCLTPNNSVTAFHLSLLDRKSTRLNSSHANISYAVFCLKKKNIYNNKCHHFESNLL